MIQYFSRIALAATAALSLAACETPPPSPGPGIMALQAGKTIVEGLPISEILTDRQNLRASINALRGLGFNPGQNPGTTIQELINLAWAENGQGQGLNAVRGLGGVGGIALLEAAARKTNNKGEYDSSINVEVSMSGMIVNFTYDDGRKNGTLEVTTKVVTSVNGQAVESTDWHWWITVLPQGYASIPKVMSDPNYFGAPNTIVFTQAMKDEVDQRGFKWKLWAKTGKIKIDKLLRNGVEITPGSPYAELLIPKPNDCIDLMSVNKPQTGTGTSQFGGYCLGRCQSPAIVNTGF